LNNAVNKYRVYRYVRVSLFAN